MLGSVFEYSKDGVRSADMDRDVTVGYMVACSRKWPNSYQQHVTSDGVVTWAKAGR